MTPVEQAIDIATALCMKYEGLSLVPYICPAGYPTIGYGTVYKPDGSKVTMAHPPISKAVATQWLVTELRDTYLLGVLKASPNLIKYPKALGAITDFAYNLGVPRYRASTLRRKVLSEDWVPVDKELMKWVKGNGRVLRGLQLRRSEECTLT